MISLLIADDHDVVRAGLELLVGTFDDVDLVGVASDGAEAVALCEVNQPDVALVDIEMPTMDGLEATRRIRETSPRTAVVVFTSFAEGHRVLAAIDAGACGYLLKDADPRGLHEAIRSAARGEGTLAPRIARLLADGAAIARKPGLSAREREVLLLLTDGLANKQIARRLGISEKTVKGHLTNIFRAIGVNDRTQAALWAERQSAEHSEVVA